MPTFLSKLFPGPIFTNNTKGNIAQTTLIGGRTKDFVHAIHDSVPGAGIGIVDKNYFLSGLCFQTIRFGYFKTMDQLRTRYGIYWPPSKTSPYFMKQEYRKACFGKFYYL